VSNVTPRWEHGSSLPFPDLAGEESPGFVRCYPTVLGTSVSGRGALLSILARVVQPQSRVWMPAYFCPDVRDAVRRACDNEVLPFPDRPRDRAFELPADLLRSGDVVVVQNLFGIRSAPAYDPEVRRSCVLVEDHTHDPLSEWALTTTVDYAFASLRKTLPVPDGGLIWSRSQGEAFPVVPNSMRMLEAIGDRVKAMLLKKEYLLGTDDVTKGAYRSYEARVEAEFARLPHGAMTALSTALLEVFPVDRWRDVHRQNFAYLSERLRSAGFDVLEASAPDAAPFGVVADLHDAALTARVRDGLLARDIYPCVLWRGEHAPDGFEQEHLILRCDYRYDKDDLGRVADAFLMLAR
jgi:hypothetical protein